MKKTFQFLQMLLTIAFTFYIVRPVKSLLSALQAFNEGMGVTPGVMANIWTANQNADAPTSSGTVSVAVASSQALNAESGVITITGLTAAAGAMQIATVTNSKILANSNVVATLNNYTGTWTTNGEPILMATTIAAGSMILRVGNIHGANALAGNVTISFRVGQVVL